MDIKPAEITDILKREIKALVFDQYGTIVDMQKGLTDAVTPFLKQKGWEGKPTSFVTWWRRAHFENSMIDALCEASLLQEHLEETLILDELGLELFDHQELAKTAEPRVDGKINQTHPTARQLRDELVFP